MSYRSQFQFEGGIEGEPDYIYYTADIVNNNSGDDPFTQDPIIRFNETRDTSLLRDSSQYHMSIIRFTLDGANKNLPLFIPSINVNQQNINLTDYSVAISYQQQFLTTDGKSHTITVAPTPTFLEYSSEIQNRQYAPAPMYPFTDSDINSRYYWNSTYSNVLRWVNSSILAAHNSGTGSISTQAGEGTYAGLLANWANLQIPASEFPFPTFQSFQDAVNTPQFSFLPQTSFTLWGDSRGFGDAIVPFSPQTINTYAWNNAITYSAGQFATTDGGATVYVSTQNNNTNNTPDDSGTWWGLVSQSPPFWLQGVQYDTYSSIIYNGVLYTNFGIINPNLPPSNPASDWVVASWSGSVGYATDQVVSYEGNWWTAIRAIDAGQPSPPANGTYWDTNLNWRYTPQIGGLPALQTSKPQERLFFNTNMYGLFSNFCDKYWNSSSITDWSIPNPDTIDGGYSVPNYVYEIIFNNDFYQNLVDFRLAPYSGNPPLGFVPTSKQAVYYALQQDWKSTTSLWSPISSIVFTTTLLPVRIEQVAAPLQVGASSNQAIGTSQSAFQPIITDIAIDTSINGAEDYRKFIYYAPSAEYRMADMTSSHQEIRNIDIQVFWKSKIDNNLYPIFMYNNSSVSLKMMFRNKRIKSKTM